MNASGAKPRASVRTAHDAASQPLLPEWTPPVCAILFGVAVALQAPGADLGPGLTDPIIGLALALGAWWILTAARARSGVRRRREPSWWVTATAVVCISDPSTFFHSTAVLRWLYLAMGIGVTGLVWYRLHKPTKSVHD
ncbi:hypothetical protein OG432_00295 [Streptomyces sp. NBC_00442]|uniref:hypothetical protein n=1 Tax=Streptomyces sp. NBC_00442 TaxID=2903651 RepID=UPI002E20CD72